MATISNSDNDNTIISGTNESDSLGNSRSNVTIYGYGGNDTINNDASFSHDSVTIDASSGDNEIYSRNSNYVYIIAENGKDTIDFVGSHSTINVGGGDNEVYLSRSGTEPSDYIYIDAGDGGDTICNFLGDNVTIAAGDGNNYIRSGGTSTYIRKNNYSSIITGGGNDTISVSSGDFVNLDAGNGDNFIEIISNNSTIRAGNGNDKITNYGNAVRITSGEGNDYILHHTSYGVAGNSTINAGTGNDTIYVITNDVIVYTEGDGNDTIINYSVDDTIQIDSTSTPSTVASGSDIIINVGEGSIRIVNATETAITAVNSSGNAINFSTGENTSTVTPVTTETDTSSTVTPVTTETITVSSGKKLDIVFLMDNTGSMRNYIESVKSAVSDFATNLQNSGLNPRYGLVEFGDNNDSNINVYDFTNDLSTFVSNVNGIATTNGGDEPESGLEAIMNGALTMNFDTDAEKRFIVITNASFHNFGETGDGNSSDYLLTTDVADALKNNNVTMDVVGREDLDYGYIEGYGYLSDNCRSEWEPLANATGGKFYLLGEGFPSIFSAITTDIVNIVDLNLVPENQTGFFVATQNSDTYTTPTFQTNGTSGNDTTVGAVNSINLYVADTETDRQQTIIITDGWNATATKNDDKLLINGVSATVTGGDGADLFSLSTDTRTVTLMDLNIDEDKLSFGNYITPGTMSQTIEDNHLVLTADDLRVDLPGMSEMTDEFLDYSVSNAGNSSTIRELLYGESSKPNTFISFAHWTFGFSSSTGF